MKGSTSIWSNERPSGLYLAESEEVRLTMPERIAARPLDGESLSEFVQEVRGIGMNVSTPTISKYGPYPCLALSAADQDKFLVIYEIGATTASNYEPWRLVQFGATAAAIASFREEVEQPLETRRLQVLLTFPGRWGPVEADGSVGAPIGGGELVQVSAEGGGELVQVSAEGGFVVLTDPAKKDGLVLRLMSGVSPTEESVLTWIGQGTQGLAMHHDGSSMVYECSGDAARVGRLWLDEIGQCWNIEFKGGNVEELRRMLDVNKGCR